MWLRQGKYEYHYDHAGNSTGWYHCVGGRTADGKWPAWNYKTGLHRETMG